MAEHDAALDFLDRQTALKIGGGLLIAGAVMYLFASWIGIGKIRAELVKANLRWLAVGCLSTAIGLVAWARAWQVVMGVVGIQVRFRKLVVTYYAATFANYVTPMGQAGGEPFIAYVLSRDTEASYEKSLASVVTADLLNLLPFFSFAAVGIVVLVFRTTLSEELQGIAVALIVFALGVPALAVAGWRFRQRLRAAALGLIAPVARRTSLVSLAGIRERVDDLIAAFERISDEPRSLAYALVFSYVGWLFFALPLYFSTLAVGESISLFLVFFIVPASTLAGLTPSPGGAGGVEGALVALLVPLAGFSYATSFSIAILYRIASWAFAILLGGLATWFVVGRS